MCITKECADPTEPGVWWREDDKWVRYNAQHSDAILASFRQLNNSTHQVLVPLGAIASGIHPSGHSYTVVLPELVQRNDRSGYTREVKIVDASVNKPASGPLVPSAQANGKGGRVNTVWFEDDDGTWQPLDFDLSASSPGRGGLPQLQSLPSGVPAKGCSSVRFAAPRLRVLPRSLLRSTSWGSPKCRVMLGARCASTKCAW